MKKQFDSKSAFFNPRVLLGFFLCLIGAVTALIAFSISSGPSALAQRPTQDPNAAAAPDVVRMVGPVRLDQDLRNLPYVPQEGETEEPLTRYPHRNTGQTSGFAPIQALIKEILRPTPTMPAPLLTFEGGAAAQFCACAPPDTDGDVGPNHYVETINNAFAVYDKNGVVLSGPTTYNSLFAPLVGTPCQNQNHGDPFVFYDHLADRWVISDFAFPALPGNGPFYQCIAVSQTPNPVSGGWFLYAVQHEPSQPLWVGDYPKMALWNNPQPGGAYHLTVNLFNGPDLTFRGVRVWAFDRAAMLAGNPSPAAIAFTVPLAGVGDSYSFVPATFRTGTAPPAGRDEMVLAVDSPASNPTTLTQVHARFFHVDFVTPANSTFGVGVNHTPNAEITVNPYVEAWTNGGGFTLVPQQGTTQLIQTLGDKIMTPVVYQNRAGVESLWAAQTNLPIATFPAGPSFIRWYQFNVTGGTFPASAAQQQDWSNGNDSVWRFMPSIAVDNAGNVAIGYATSNGTSFPGIRYAGRLATDAINNLGQGEATMFAGTGSQTGTNGRWGDYSMTSIDPADGMSFWTLGEYYSTTSSFNWRTRVGKFKFPTVGTWGTGPVFPSVGVRQVGVYFPANGKFYAMGGRSSDVAGSDFTHPFEYDPGTNTWATKVATFPDTQVNNMACGVHTVSGTPQIYCVGGSAAGGTTATARVFSYNPVTDSITTLAAGDNWPGDVAGTILPGGFAVTGNKLYILGGFNINVASTNQIWQFDPTLGVGAKWTQMVNTPVGIMYAPTAAIGGIIYVGGASDFVGAAVTDNTTSFSFNPASNTIGAITAIPRATGETRALNFNGRMLVMGGGRVAPNPSNQVDIYDPGTNAWTTGTPVPAFTTARRNFATDTDGTARIWLVGGYAPTTPTDSMEIFPSVLVPSSAVSRKVHGAFTGDINLPLVAIGGAVGIECRNGAGVYQMVVTFASPVTLTGATVTNGTGSATFSGSGTAVITVNLTGVTDQQRLGVTLNNVSDGTTTTNILIPMGVLIGDSIGNGTVNAGDVGFVKSQSGVAVGAGNFRADVIINGTINAGDIGQVKANSGHVLPP
jgi:hypothetical protein